MAATGVAGADLARDLVIDDRTSGDMRSNLGTSWRLVTDTVMGGVSRGELVTTTRSGRECLQMRGDVSTENNGGFVQMALDLADAGAFDASSFDGIEFLAAGNDEAYNLHLRTSGLWLPWQSYRFGFEAGEQWRTVRVPFAALEPYRTGQAFEPHRLRRLGLVAIGRDFTADLCVASVRFYGE